MYRMITCKWRGLLFLHTSQLTFTTFHPGRRIDHSTCYLGPKNGSVSAGTFLLTFLLPFLVITMFHRSLFYGLLLPAWHYLCAVISHSRVSVCVCLTRWYCIKMAKHRITQTMPRNSPWTLVFWRQNLLVDDLPFPLKFALKVTHPFLNTTISTSIRS